MEVYINNARHRAIMCITDNVMVTLYSSAGKNPVIPPIKVNDVETLFLAESVPSAAALHFTEEVSDKLKRSHLVFESPNLGLLMRYLLEKESYTTDISFSNEVTIKVGELTDTWFFSDMQKWRDEERDDFSNAVIRSTFKTDMYELEENTFSANIWHSRVAVVCNIGILIFQKAKLKEKPELVPWDSTFTMQIRNQAEVQDDKSNLIVFGIDSEEKTFSVPKRDMLQKFAEKVNRMRTEMKTCKNPLAGYPKHM